MKVRVTLSGKGAGGGVMARHVRDQRCETVLTGGGMMTLPDTYYFRIMNLYLMRVM